METSHQIREKTASRAFEALGQNPSDNLVLMVQCPHSHHLAAIYDTAAGHVYHSVLHAVSHGRKDYEDLGHHASRLGRDWFDLLDVADPAVSDDLEAGCECGPYSLSRQQLIQQIADGEKRVIVSG